MLSDKIYFSENCGNSEESTKTGHQTPIHQLFCDDMVKSRKS